MHSQIKKCTNLYFLFNCIKNILLFSGQCDSRSVSRFTLLRTKMSVEVKTPSQHLFEHSEFQCGEKTRQIKKDHISSPEDNDRYERKRQLFRERSSTWAGSGRGRKRRASERTGGNENRQYQRKRFCRYGPRHSKIVLPTKFLLGGNISDPLNLNSMCDEEINKALNKTPDSSPFPLPFKRQTVEIIIPANLSDPLNLMTGDDEDNNLISPRTKRKRSKYRHKKKLAGDEEDDKTTDEIAADNRTMQESRRRSQEKKIMDAIVSPVIPQDLPKKRRKRNSSEDLNKSDHEDDHLFPQKSQKVKYHRQSSGNTIINSGQKYHPMRQRNKVKKVYEYGNYNSYYGNVHMTSIEDKRLHFFKRDWFEGRDVLDIGCNVGHVTISVARDFHPRRIVGLDIDGDLIQLARKNVRHYLSRETTGANKFPSSMATMYGPLVGPPIAKKNQHTPTRRYKHKSMLDNISFVQVYTIWEPI